MYRRPAARTTTCWRPPQPARPIAVCSSPIIRRRDVAVSTGAGTPRRASTCWCRSCSARCRPRVGTDAAGRTGRDRRLPRGGRGRGGAEVAERPPPRRSQAGRNPGPAGGRRFDRGGAGLERRLGARRRGVVARAHARRVRPTPLDLLAALLTAFDALPDDIGPRYRAALATLGRRVDVQVPSGRIDGRAVDIDGDGRLVVVDTCGLTHRLDVGDVVHVRDAAPPADIGRPTRRVTRRSDPRCDTRRCQQPARLARYRCGP